MVDWSVALTIFLAIIAASMVERWIERHQVGSLSAAEREKAVAAPETVDQYARRKYPGALNA